MGRLVVLGLIQGLAEFLPVSSSGHLLLVRQLWHWGPEGPSLEVLLHGATLISVLVAMRRRVMSLGRRWWAGEPLARRLVWAVVVATVPAAVVGAAGGHALAAWLFRPPVAAAGFLGTTALLATAPAPKRGRRALDDVRLADALLVGLAQAAALCPGLSRSGATMAAARWCGLLPEAAAELSFLMAIPITAGVVAVSLPAVTAFGPGLALAAIAASTAGVMAVQWALRGIRTQRWWRGFAGYTLLMAVLAASVGR